MKILICPGSLYNSGKASNLDISRVKVHLSKAEGGLIDAEANLKIARENLFTLSRIKDKDDKIGGGELNAREFKYTLQKLIDIALRNREELKIADYRINISKKKQVARKDPQSS